MTEIFIDEKQYTTEQTHNKQVPNVSDVFGTMPNHSENFRNIPQASETFCTVPNDSERKEDQILTVREVAKLFENAGVARTERSIINWCQPGKIGVPRLDAYYDPNERKYFISPQSVERVIAEEKSKAAKQSPAAIPVDSVPNDAEKTREGSGNSSNNASEHDESLEKQVMDLKILNSGKDYVIQQLRQERDGFIQKLLDASRQVGQLETKLLQLERPFQGSSER